jgi:hypothetical protein
MARPRSGRRTTTARLHVLGARRGLARYPLRRVTAWVRGQETFTSTGVRQSQVRLGAEPCAARYRRSWHEADRMRPVATRARRSVQQWRRTSRISDEHPLCRIDYHRSDLGTTGASDESLHVCGRESKGLGADAPTGSHFKEARLRLRQRTARPTSSIRTTRSTPERGLGRVDIQEPGRVL